MTGNDKTRQGTTQPPGPEPERLTIEGFESWEDAVRAGLTKPPPPGGWPERADDKQPPKRKQGRRPK